MSRETTTATSRDVLTADEVAEIRAVVNRADPTIGPGFTGDAIVRLCDTVDALRHQLAALSHPETS